MRMIRRLSVAALALLAALLLAWLAAAAYLGWFGGPIYRLYPATARAGAPASDVAVVYLTGDAGIKVGLGPQVMAMLAARGVPVLGINTLTAFADHRSPDEVRALIADATTRALHLPGIRRVVLAGQSFGADMVQFGAADLPTSLRPRVAALVIAVPGDGLVFRAMPLGLFEATFERPALPSARRIDWLPVTCIHGATERGSLCPLLRGANVRSIALPGDHFLNRDPAALANAMWRAIRPTLDEGRTA